MLWSPQLAFFESMKQLSFSCASSASAAACTVLKRRRSVAGSAVGRPIDHQRGTEPVLLHLKPGAVSVTTASSSPAASQEQVKLMIFIPLVVESNDHVWCGWDYYIIDQYRNCVLLKGCALEGVFALQGLRKGDQEAHLQDGRSEFDF